MKFRSQTSKFHESSTTQIDDISWLISSTRISRAIASFYSADAIQPSLKGNGASLLEFRYDVYRIEEIVRSLGGP